MDWWEVRCYVLNVFSSSATPGNGSRPRTTGRRSSREAEEELSRTKRRHASEMTKMENRVGLHRSAKERLQSQCADMEGLL